jgi:hypothetical protein
MGVTQLGQFTMWPALPGGPVTRWLHLGQWKRIIELSPRCFQVRPLPLRDWTTLRKMKIMAVVLLTTIFGR